MNLKVPEGAGKNYYPFLDLVRVVACFLVILLHVAATRFYALGEHWWITVIYDSVARMCVPLFFMLSGFLLLDSDITSLTRFYCKRYARLLLPFGVVCILYYFSPQYAGFGLGQYFWYILNFFVDYHLWYIYVLIGIYFSLPFIIKIIHGDSGLKLALLYVVVWFLTCVLYTTASRYFRFDNGFLPAINFIFPNGGMEWMVYDHYPNIFLNFNFRFFFGFTGYLLCGWLIRQTLKLYGVKTWLCCLLIYLCSNLAIIIMTMRHSLALGQPNGLFFDNLTPFVFLQAISFFILCAGYKAASPWLRNLADKTFWIYLLHLFWLRFVYGLFPLEVNMNLLWSIPLMACAVFACAWLCAIPFRALEKFLTMWFHSRH